MTRDLSAGLLRENEAVLDSGSTLFAIDEAFFKDSRSSYKAYDSKNSQINLHSFKQTIVCEYYDPMEDDFLSFEGTILFLNRDELCFAAKMSVETEMPILIKRKFPLKNHAKIALDKGKHAEVVACEKYNAQTDEDLYRITAAYYCSQLK